MEKLTLNYREVARANVERFDELGTFAGETRCMYHYPSGKHCAIGLMDDRAVFTSSNDVTPSSNLESISHLVSMDEPKILYFIQKLHDYKMYFGSKTLSGFVHDEPPQVVADLVATVLSPVDLTREVYVSIMSRLASS